MKRFYLVFISCFILLNIFKIKAFAIGIDDVAYETDELGRVTKGYLHVEGNDYYGHPHKWNYIIDSNGNGPLYIRYNGTEGGFMYCNDYSTGYTRDFCDYYVESGYTETSTSGAGGGAQVFSADHTWSSNIPAFDTSKEGWEDRLNAYLNDGDISGADNADDVKPEQDLEYSTDIELPVNFKVVSGYKYSLQNVNILDTYIFGINHLTKNIVYTWEQTVDTSDYKYEIDVKFNYLNYEKEKHGEVSYTTDWISYGDNVDYNGSKNITMTLEHNRLNSFIKSDAESRGISSPLGYYPAGGIDAIRHVYVRVRNIEGQNCSNYVSSDIDIGAKKVSNSEKDADDVTVDDAEYDNDDGTRDKNDDTDVTDITKLKDTSNIVEFIKSGFGILGEKGILGFIKNFFRTCMPVDGGFWGLVTLGFAVMILVGIVNFILKR